MSRRPRKKKDTTLDHAKDVLRRTGATVCDAKIIDPRDRSGAIWVDTRRHTAAEVIAQADEIERREAQRNAELRKQFGLQ